MKRYERARLRRAAQMYARAFLNVRRLPAGVPALVRAYADGFERYPFGPWMGWTEVTVGHPFDGLGHMLRRYRKPMMLV